MRIFSKGFNFNQDGPGNRLVYHLQGCNMRCIWCSNPEGMSLDGGEEYTVLEMLDECIRSKLMFFSGGGVTFTGGEATVQYSELQELIKLLKSENIHTCIETNGTSKGLTELLQYIDYLIMDFKHYDSRTLEKYTGIGNDTVKMNYESNCKTGRQQHIRIPLINGINTDDPNGFAEYFSRFDTKNTVFEFLSYHEYGRQKWKGEYKVKNGFVPSETLEKFKETFMAYNLNLITT